MRRMWVLVLVLGACRSPCKESGEYAFFGRRAVMPGTDQQGTCSETIEGTVTFLADGGAAFRVAGFEGTCKRSNQDLRPEYDVCSISLDCDGRSPNGLATLSLSTVFNTKDGGANALDGFSDVGNAFQAPAKWTQNDTVCVGHYQWAATRNP